MITFVSSAAEGASGDSCWCWHWVSEFLAHFWWLQGKQRGSHLVSPLASPSVQFLRVPTSYWSRSCFLSTHDRPRVWLPVSKERIRSRQQKFRNPAPTIATIHHRSLDYLIPTLKSGGLASLEQKTSGVVEGVDKKQDLLGCNVGTRRNCTKGEAKGETKWLPLWFALSHRKKKSKTQSQHLPTSVTACYIGGTMSFRSCTISRTAPE